MVVSGALKSVAINIFVVVALLSLCGHFAEGKETYVVGGDDGWLVPGPNSNYSVWASNKTFQIGDTLVFVYDDEMHNVLEVSHKDYEACNSQSPIMAYASGNDSITINKDGSLYFICGVPGHCQAGQRFGITVAKGGSDPSPPPSSPATPPAPSDGTDPDAKKSHAPAAHMGLALGVVVGAVAAVAGLISPY